MQTNIPLACDPYEGAYRAYQLLNPSATGQDWEVWVAGVGRCTNGHFDYFAAYGSLCHRALGEVSDLEPSISRMLNYSVGYFNAMESVVNGLIDILPTSGRIPHHMDRYRYNLIKFPERYIEEESDDQV